MDSVFTVLIVAAALVSVICGVAGRIIAWRKRAKA